MKEIFRILAVVAYPAISTADPNPYAEKQGLFQGPFRATVVRVIDADTISVEIDLWPGSIQMGAIRVRNIDAPETRTRCETEKALGLKAKHWVQRMYPVGEVIRLDDVESDPFSGRFVADVRRWRSDRWLYLAEELLERDFAEIWQPGDPVIDWCVIAGKRLK